MRFSLVDRITELTPGQKITAIKNLSSAEEYLADHFPGFPVMPGVLMLETLVQAGAWLLRATHDFEFSMVLLQEAKALRFNSFVTPGDTLVVHAEIVKTVDNIVTLKASGHAAHQPEVNTVSARLLLKQFNLQDHQPDLAETDTRRITELRQEFGRLWTKPTAATSTE